MKRWYIGLIAWNLIFESVMLFLDGMGIDSYPNTETMIASILFQISTTLFVVVLFWED